MLTRLRGERDLERGREKGPEVGGGDIAEGAHECIRCLVRAPQWHGKPNKGAPRQQLLSEAHSVGTLQACILYVTTREKA